jgi:hypothetical protein
VLVRPSLSFDVRYEYLLYLLLPYYSHPRHTPIRSPTSNRPISQARKSRTPNPPARLIAGQRTRTGHLSYCFLISTHAIPQRHIFSTLSLNPSKYLPLRLPSIACLLFVSISHENHVTSRQGGRVRCSLAHVRWNCALGLLGEKWVVVWGVDLGGAELNSCLERECIYGIVFISSLVGEELIIHFG